jgi:gluconolactonase
VESRCNQGRHFLETQRHDDADAWISRAGFKRLNVDAKGNLLICQHGDRRISRYVNGKFETVADKYDGKRFNSPNDLALRGNGDIYFTDPPYGLEKLNDSPLKEMPWNGVYRVTSEG